MNGKSPPLRLHLTALAREFTVSPDTVRRWMKRGCPYLRAGANVWFLLDEVETWMRLQGKERL